MRGGAAVDSPGAVSGGALVLMMRDRQLPKTGNELHSARDRSNHQKWVFARSHRLRQRRIWRFMRQVFLAGKKAQERTTLLRDMVSNRSQQHGITRFQRIQHRSLRDWICDLQHHLAAHVRQRAQMLWQHNPDHCSVCTSTDNTAGRSCTMAFQLSPASFEAYTCPPDVPKYRPQESSWSTAIASRSTFT